MGFKSVNEIEKFTFDDCVISSFKVNEAGIILVLEALIVDSNNSQNTNYTESYADTTTVRLLDGKIITQADKVFQTCENQRSGHFGVLHIAVCGNCKLVCAYGVGVLYLLVLLLLFLSLR